MAKELFRSKECLERKSSIQMNMEKRVFLGKLINTNQMENLMKTLVSHSFETDILCVNAGYAEVRKLFKVVIRERKSRDMIF